MGDVTFNQLSTSNHVSPSLRNNIPISAPQAHVAHFWPSPSVDKGHEMQRFSYRSILVAIATIFALSISAVPSTALAGEIRGEISFDGIQSADFDLSIRAEQSKTIDLGDGTTAEIGIRPVSSIIPYWDSYRQNASGSYEIYCNSPIVYRHFYITISNHKITKAHSPSFTAFLCTVSSESFTWNSTVATYRLTVDSFGLLSTVAVLQAIMEGTTLHTYAN